MSRFLLYTRDHRLLPTLAILAICLAVSAFFALDALAAPLVDNVVQIPIPYLSSCLAATVSVASTGSRVDRMEDMDTGTITRARLAHLIVLPLFAAGYAGTIGIPAHTSGLQVARGFLGFYALALVSASLTRAEWAGLLPFLAIPALPNVPRPEALNWVLAPIGSACAWALTLAAVALGYILVLAGTNVRWLNPWVSR